MQQEFIKAYRRLNELQRQSVDFIEGPLLVIAGPGTGKTELLAVRVANILKKTDADPGNILCLTFTESAKTTMQSRLGRLIGPQATQVAVHTFHSFGSHIIGTHGDNFSEAFGYRPSDDVTRYQILVNILERLGHDERLSSLYNGEFYYLKNIQERISQLKQAGLAPKDFKRQVKSDWAWVNRATPKLNEHLAGMSRLNLKRLPDFEALAADFNNWHTSSPLPLAAIGNLCANELNGALEASEGQRTKPLTQWKNKWLTKNGAGQFIFKAAGNLTKLSELADIYKSYQQQLSARRLFDYDDMIMRVIGALGNSDELRAELQEQYQYILVDEYQDTNGAQLRLLQLLADNPINEGRPNLMVVGDDDQAIYGFQGAYQSNVLDFLQHWPLAEKIVLNINYRSTAEILRLARQLIIQGQERLETTKHNFTKELVADKQAAAPQPRLELFASRVEQYGWLAATVKKLLESGQEARQIAIIAPKHKYLEALVPYLQDRSVALAYERREDVLQQPHVVQLLNLARLIVYVAGGEIAQANQRIPEILSYPWWKLQPGWLWEIALAASRSDRPWLELMLTSRRREIKKIANWVLVQAKTSQTAPLEPMMDVLMGPAEPLKQFASPYRHFYFGHDSEQDSISYLKLLSGLVSLRTALRQYQPDHAPRLIDFVDFADIRTDANLPLRNDHPLALDSSAVQLLTVHKAKGLEFEQVFLVNADEYTWRQERGRGNNLVLPPNYARLAPSGESIDEKLRVFYVAATRAKDRLTLTGYTASDDGQPTLPLGWLQPLPVQSNLVSVEPEKHPRQPTAELTRQLGFDWLTPHFELRTKAPWRALLQSQMEQYQLSPTHLSAFLDVSRGGPKAFLVNQLLRFPQALSVNAQFGNVMHAVMQRMHSYFNDNAKMPAYRAAVKWLDESVANYYFGPLEDPKARRRGRISLDAIYAQLAGNFQVGQLAEYSFAGEGVVIGQARLKGIIDCLQLDKINRTAVITDYKSGAPLKSFAGGPKSDNYETAKAHRYRQQLLFYKLLVDNSPKFRGYRASRGQLIFVEPDEEQNIQRLELEYDDQEIEHLTALIAAAYQRIISLDLPDTSRYKPNISGTLQFEADLISGKI